MDRVQQTWLQKRIVLLAEISDAAIDELTHRALDLSMPFLRALDQTLAKRIRADNNRYREALRLARAGG